MNLLVYEIGSSPMTIKPPNSVYDLDEARHIAARIKDRRSGRRSEIREAAAEALLEAVKAVLDGAGLHGGSLGERTKGSLSFNDGRSQAALIWTGIPTGGSLTVLANQ